MLRVPLTLITLALCAASLGAQSFIPPRTGTILLGDRSGDVIWAMNDFNFDADYHDPGECVVFYGNVGGPAITNVQDIAVGPDGTAYVADAGSDTITKLVDLNLDGDAEDMLEATVFFDLTNAGGIQAGSMTGITVENTSPPVVWVANSSNGAAPRDMLLRIEDLNGDGDGNDANEAVVFWEKTVALPNTGYDLDIPASVHVLPNGDVLLLHGAGGAATAPKGIYLLRDLNADGDANDAGEITPWYELPAGSTPISFEMTPSRNGDLYVVDRGAADSIYALRDADGDGSITGSEAVVYWSAPGASTIDNMCEVIAFDGTPVLLVAEDSGVDRLLGLVDLDGSGTIDLTTETVTLHDTGIPGVVDFGQPKAVEALAGPYLSGPTSVVPGQTFTTTHEGVKAHSFFAGYSPVAPPVFAPPYGLYHLGTFPPPGYSVLLDIVPADGTYEIGFTIPNLPGLSGFAFNSQSYEFDGFFGRLSNLHQITIN